MVLSRDCDRGAASAAGPVAFLASSHRGAAERRRGTHRDTWDGLAGKLTGKTWDGLAEDPGGNSQGNLGESHRGA